MNNAESDYTSPDRGDDLLKKSGTTLPPMPKSDLRKSKTTSHVQSIVEKRRAARHDSASDNSDDLGPDDGSIEYFMKKKE